MNDPILNTMENRSFPVTYNEDNNTVSLVFSTGERVFRNAFKPYFEELSISQESIDFSRLNNGAPVLKNHDRSSLDSVIGVVESAKVENSNAIASIRFSNRPDVQPIIQDIRDGILRNISVGYQINKVEKIGEEQDVPVMRVTGWTPMEVSVVPVPADKHSQFRSQTEENIITEEKPIMENTILENKEEARVVDTPETIDVNAIVAEERTRVSEITKTVRSAGLDTTFADTLINSGVSLTEARSAILDEVIKKQPKVTNTATTVVDANEKRNAGLESALLIRAGYEKNDPSNEFRSYNLVEMAKLFAPGQHDRMAIVGRAFSTSDFPYILANVANKSLQNGYTTSPETWQQWTRTISVSDFKTLSILALSEFSSLDSVPEAAEYKYGSLSEKREQFTLGTYGKLFAITRQAIINDDLNALTSIPNAMGRAAARKVGDIVYGVLTTNGNLADGHALFYARTQTNIGGGSISVAAIDTARTLMALQKDVSGTTVLGLRPKFLLAPVTLEGTANVILTAQYDPDTASKLQRPNMVQNAATLVTDARLDATSTSVWYLAADPNVFDTVVVAFLDGNQTPALEQQLGWNVDGVEYKVRIDVAAGAVDYRGLVRSA